ncbi:hypothetical protein HDU96_007322 [Phlyctochytrium bullatum]|nr:hypothetical protein HDU96_007322 [Phlyctochytrium bullatum]
MMTPPPLSAKAQKINGARPDSPSSRQSPTPQPAQLSTSPSTAFAIPAIPTLRPSSPLSASVPTYPPVSASQASTRNRPYDPPTSASQPPATPRANDAASTHESFELVMDDDEHDAEVPAGGSGSDPFATPSNSARASPASFHRSAAQQQGNTPPAMTPYQMYQTYRKGSMADDDTQNPFDSSSSAASSSPPPTGTRPPPISTSRAPSLASGKQGGSSSPRSIRRNANGTPRYYETRRKQPDLDDGASSFDLAVSVGGNWTDLGGATASEGNGTGTGGDGASSFFMLDTASMDYQKHSLMVEHLYKAMRAKGWLDADGDEGAVSLRINSSRGNAMPHRPGMRAAAVAAQQQQAANGNGGGVSPGGVMMGQQQPPHRPSVDSYGAASSFTSRAASIKSYRSGGGAGGGAAPLFVTYPEPNADFTRAVRGLNVEVAVMLTSRMIRTAIDMVPLQNNDLKLRDGNRLQVIENLSRLPRARKLQYAALSRLEGALIVWTNSIDTIIDAAQAAQDQLIKVVWSGLPQPIESEEEEEVSAAEGVAEDGDKAQLGAGQAGQVGMVDSKAEKDLTTIERRRKKYGRTRPIYFIWPIISTLSICVTILFFGFGVSVLVRESLIDGTWYRMALIGLLPLQILFTQFVPQAAIACLFQIIGPIKQLEGNSLFYSGLPPKRLLRGNLPHITIQMPVYTESLDGVLDPTIQSLQKAIATYESQGGSASIFVNEDGMQVIPEEQAELRRRYYADHNIGWVARPKHNHNGFIRRGRFKKASNMNFCLMISRNLEQLLEAEPELDYDEALERVVEEDGRAWAAGDIQIGDIILIVDSDTRVPEDCLLDAAAEFMESPDVAIIQHQASPMLVTFNFFERGIAYFTQIIYTSIRYCCASGETSPFVGHNAFLRWSAIKEVAFEEDDQIKYWSESHVSEDFDMSLRLQIKGYIIRYAAYHGDGFQEGVSLSVYDEVGRWQKYAYGCSELVFHPLKDMLCKGIFTPLFWKFLFSNMNLYSKINIIGYIGSYYAIGAAWILTLLNYFLIGYWDDEVDAYYLPSFDVLVTTISVFTVLSNLSFAVFRHRLKEKNFFLALLENVCWMPFFAVFFSGLSFHVSLALVSHLIGYNMTWGTTAKELESSNFFKEVPKVLSGYKRMYIIFLALVAMLPIMTYVPPLEWTISGVTLIVPAVLVFAGHLLLPVALNPSLMTFSF